MTSGLLAPTPRLSGPSFSVDPSRPVLGRPATPGGTGAPIMRQRVQDCPHMRRNTLEKLWRCLHDGSPEVSLEPALAQRARLPIERMLAIG